MSDISSHGDLLLDLAKGQASMGATMESMKDTMEKGFHYFKEQNEAMAKIVETKAAEEDVKTLTDNYHDLDKRVTKILTIGGTLQAVAAFVIAGATAWWTKH